MRWPVTGGWYYIAYHWPPMFIKSISYSDHKEHIHIIMILTDKEYCMVDYSWGDHVAQTAHCLVQGSLMIEAAE